MNFTRISTLALFFLQLSVFAQTKTKGLSRILNSNLSDTAFLNVEMTGAEYDFAKKNFPFYVVSNVTSYDQSSKPTLIVKKTLLVEEPHASVIKKYFSRFITNHFKLEEIPSLSKNKNLNHYKLFPFRLNNSDQLEELITYDVTWQTYRNNNLNARQASSSGFSSGSVLSSGTWYKIAVTQSGIHKISKSFLASIGINTSNLDYNKIRVYGNGGKMLPELNGSFRYDDLQENSIKVVPASDGTFDYALFYATGPTEWVRSNAPGLKFSAIKNLYSDTSFYFINVDLGNGKRIGSRQSLSQPPNFTSNSYDYYNFHELDITNFGKSGRSFFGEYFDLTNSYSFSWNDGDFVVNDSVIAEVSLVALYSNNTTFVVNGSGNGLNFNLTTAGIQSNTYSDFAAPAIQYGQALMQNNSNITLSVTKITPKSLGWLDKVTVNARRSLNFSNKQFIFRDSRVTGQYKTCNFSISTSSSVGLNLWDVTDPLNPVSQEFNSNGGGINFTCGVDSLNEFCIAPSTDFYTPTFVGKIANQNIHAITQANYLIITHPLFVREAEEMGVFHQQHEGFSYAIATTDQIYNEFSSGRQDISAIRDFIRMVYTRNISLTEDKQVKYVLLMGDGSYDNRNRSLVNNSDLIPAYESQESLDPIASITTDDFYGLMDPDEGYNAEGYGKIDLGVGRFPCRTETDVKGIIAKIVNYYRKDPGFVANNSIPETSATPNESPMGDWRTWLLFLGDDEDNALHMKQSDSLVRVIKAYAPIYNIDDIQLDAYQRFSTPGGSRYPDASADFLKRIEKGTVIFNYTGHGGEVGLTAERLVDIDMINNLDNFNKLPLFITATCEFSRFDDPSRTSAGELCILNPRGGAIALYSTCRVAYSNYNLTINSEVLKRLFSLLPTNKHPTLGDALYLTKSSPALGGQAYYYANFHLFGDPALVLSYPEQKVFTSSVNNAPVTQTSSDTLSALSKITITGFVADTSGNKLTNFNGLVYPTVFDKEQTVVCLLNSPASATYLTDTSTVLSPYQFKLQKNILYRGKSLVTNGNFSFTFIVPKDVSFAIGPGKISYYATDGTTDADGYYNRLLVGGTSSKNAIVDNQGPQVNLFLNDKSFISGGLTNENPVLFADLIDSSGINTLGTSIGHDISAVMDANTSNPVVLNDYYEANLNSYQSGRVRYPYAGLSDGAHRLSFKVWDIQNNSSTVYADFIVAQSAELALQHVLNYPNPFTTRTKFMFQHNQVCNPLKVTIQIYTVSGKIVKTIQKSTGCDGSVPEGIEWDGKDDYGDKLARGVYIYKLAILDVDNKKAEKIEKLVILN
jgi:hypothetical protein